jgi:hypothetical protein
MVEKYEETREISANQHNFLTQHLKYHVNVFANTVPNKNTFQPQAQAASHYISRPIRPPFNSLTTRKCASFEPEEQLNGATYIKFFCFLRPSRHYQKDRVSLA